jgi:hypothetical protein
VLVGQLDRNEAHGLADDSFGVSSIRLVAFYKGLDVSWRDAAHVVAELGDLVRPIAGTATGCHPDKARRLILEELHHFAAAEFAIEDRDAILLRAVNLKGILRQTQPDKANIPHGTVTHLLRSKTTKSLHVEAFGGPFHFINLGETPHCLARIVPEDCVSSRLSLYMGDPLGDLRTVQGDTVEKAQGTDRLIERWPRNTL